MPWGTIAPPGCSSVSVMSLRIWVKFFLILCVCQQLLSGSCRSLCLTLNYSNTLIYIIAEINRLTKKEIPSSHFKYLDFCFFLSLNGSILVITTRRLRGGGRRLWQESSCTVTVAWQKKGELLSVLPLLCLKFWHMHPQQQQWCNLVTRLWHLYSQPKPGSYLPSTVLYSA